MDYPRSFSCEHFTLRDYGNFISRYGERFGCHVQTGDHRRFIKALPLWLHVSSRGNSCVVIMTIAVNLGNLDN